MGIGSVPETPSSADFDDEADPPSSELGFKPVFVVGVPRSGTTWVQHCLAQHPDVAVTPRETHLFTRYLGPLLDRFDREKEEAGSDGLRHIFPRRRLLQTAIRSMVVAVLNEIRAARPGAAVVVEKTPRHLHFVPIIEVILASQARYLHVVRDPRSVVASYQAAARETWGAWADRPVLEIARLWTNAVVRDRGYSSRIGARYLSIRYEDLSANFDGTIGRVLTTLDLPPAQITRHDPSDLVGEGGTPGAFGERRPRFFRSGLTDAWHRELSRQDVALIEDICGAEMTAYGYELTGARAAEGGSV